METFDKIRNKMSILTTLLLIYLLALGLSIMFTPQNPVDWTNKWILYPIIVFAISLWRDLK